MKQKNVTFRTWLIRFLILFSFVGIGFLLSAGSIESLLASLQGESNWAYAEQPSRPRPEIDLQVPEITEKALFALGWFWGIDSRFGSVQGVYRTDVGYAGGSESKPNYLSIKDHSEVVLVEFDPQKVSYQQLLEIFWASHNPTHEIFSRQYRNAVFYLSEEQRIQAEQSRAAIRKIKNRPVYTAIEKAGDFYSAASCAKANSGTKTRISIRNFIDFIYLPKLVHS